MSERVGPPDLEAGERELHELLSRARPYAPPFGFRDGVMTRLRSHRRVGWEWLVAILFALPSAAYLARQLVVHGEDFATALANIAAAAATETSDAFFFVDGLTVLAVALLGLACAVAAHALSVSGRRAVAR